MIHPNKVFLSTASILMLFFHPIVHAENNGSLQEDLQLLIQIEQLQAQVKNTYSKIAALEIAMNTANQDINALRNSKALRLDSQKPADNAVPRTANGHGR